MIGFLGNPNHIFAERPTLGKLAAIGMAPD
jgi:hypothetical protein